MHVCMRACVRVIERLSFNIQDQHKQEVISAQKMSHKKQQRPESPMVTLTWHACKYKVQNHQRYILTFKINKNKFIFNFNLLLIFKDTDFRQKPSFTICAYKTQQ